LLSFPFDAQLLLYNLEENRSMLHSSAAAAAQIKHHLMNCQLKNVIDKGSYGKRFTGDYTVIQENTGEYRRIQENTG